MAKRGWASLLVSGLSDKIQDTQYFNVLNLATLVSGPQTG